MTSGGLFTLPKLTYIKSDKSSRSSSRAGAWVEAPTQLRGLRSLRLALSDVRELALALPSLTTLDVNGCAGLATLELHCPALLHGLFQSVGRCAAGLPAESFSHSSRSA